MIHRSTFIAVVVFVAILSAFFGAYRQNIVDSRDFRRALAEEEVCSRTLYGRDQIGHQAFIRATVGPGPFSTEQAPPPLNPGDCYVWGRWDEPRYNMSGCWMRCYGEAEWHREEPCLKESPP